MSYMGDPNCVTPEAAHHVLFMFDLAQPGVVGYPPGLFHTNLIKAVASADDTNRLRLNKSFPEYVAAVGIVEAYGASPLRKVATAGRTEAKT